MKIKIDGEVYDVDKVFTGGYLPLLECGKLEFYVASDSESAGEAAAKYWEDMAKSDPKEFTCIIGEERLVLWALGQSDSYGFDCLQDFLDTTATVPEEQWASYDGAERDVEALDDGLDEDEEAELKALTNSEADLTEEQELRLERLEEQRDQYDGWQELVDELGFTPTVAYRHN